MLNQINIMGRLVRDPELRYTQSRIQVATFTLAVERDFKGDGGNRAVDYIDCVAWRQTADFVHKYFAKGRMAIVQGRLESHKWVDNDGANRVSWQVVAEQMYFGDSKRPADLSEGNAPEKGLPAPSKQPLYDIQDDGELPF